MSSGTLFTAISNGSVKKLLSLYFLPGVLFILGILVIEKGPSFENWHGYLVGFTSELVLHFLLFIALSMAAGYIIEDFGSWWEMKYCAPIVINHIGKDIDGVNAQVKIANRSLNSSQIYGFGWERFLAISYSPEEKTGHRFLRYMLDRFKFELHAGFVFYLLFIYILVSSLYICFIEDNAALSAYKLCFLFLFWILSRFLLSREAPASAISLHNVRLILIVSSDRDW